MPLYIIIKTGQVLFLLKFFKKPNTFNNFQKKEDYRKNSTIMYYNERSQSEDTFRNLLLLKVILMSTKHYNAT